MREIIFIAIVLLGCVAKQTADKSNAEAIRIHNAMVEQAGAIEETLTELKSDSSINQDSLAQLAMALQHWRRELVEIPGNEEHDHHDHVHNHSSTPDLAPEQILAIQIELSERLDGINKRVNNLKSN